MSRTLKYDIPGADWRVPPEALRDPEALFAPAPGAAELLVDIGFGRGEFLLELAGRHPRAACLGVEVSHKRVLKLARRLARSDLSNVRLVHATADLAIAELPEESVARAWINFSDPWPKKRHHRRRLVAPPFVAALARRLHPGGELCVATDHAEYAEVIGEVLASQPLLENAFAPDPFRCEMPERTPTAYEREWQAEGRTCRYFTYRRRAAAGPSLR